MPRLLAHFIGTSGKPVIDGKFFDPRSFEDGVATFASTDSGKVGLIDRKGAQLLAPTYDYIESFVEGVASANLGGAFVNGQVRGGVWGLVKADGSEILAPSWDAMLLPDSGRVTVRRGNMFGFLDTTGKVVVEPRFEYMSWHSEGLAVVFDGADGYMDVDGNWAIAPRFQEGTVFKDGLAKVKLGNLWGVIDKQGKQVHECIYEKLGAIAGGACWAVRDGKCYVLAADGTVLGGRHFDEIKQVDEDGIWPVRSGDAWGFVRPDGEVVGMGFSGAFAFSSGLARVARDGQWGFADKDGNVVVECAYADAWAMAENRAAVSIEDEGWIYIDETGKRLGAGGLSAGNKFVDGFAPFQKDGLWGFLGHDGAVAIEPTFDWASYFKDGVAIAYNADRGKLTTVGAPDGVHTMPEGGLAHPVFEGAGEDSHIIAVIGFAADLDNSQQELLRKIVLWWERSCHPSGKLYTEDKWLSPFNLYVRVQNLADPVAAVSLLVDQILEAGLPVNETLYARWGWPANDKVMAPKPDPRQPIVEPYFEDFDAYWEAVWSDDGPIPAPENHFYLKGALQDQNGNLTLEERHTPLWMPDIKICMGAMQDQGEDYLDPTELSDRVFEVLEEKIHQRFERVWNKPGTEPRFPFAMTRDGDPGVEPIEYDGRTGYAFAFQCGVLLHWFSSPRMRFREPELMEALRATILELDLAPVIMWQRFQQQLPMLPMGRPTVLVVNLWDKQA